MSNMNAVLMLLTTLAIPAAAVAQVGHGPESSPYRELMSKQAASVVTGYLWGSQGRVNVGPSNGPLAGIRYEHAIGTPADIQIGLSFAHLERMSIDPAKPVATRITGPISQDIVMMETGLSLVLMGRKTWHGFSPFIGGNLGVAFETGLGGTDPYQYGTKAIFAPHIGFKWYPVQQFSLKVEGRDYFWRLSYPPQYSTGVGGLPAVLPAGDPGTEWTMHPTLMFSIGYTFTR